MLDQVTQWCIAANFLLGPSSRDFEFLDLASDRLYAWPEFSAAVDSRYAAFERAGIDRGKRVLMTHGNSFEFFVDLIAALARSAVVIVADGQLTASEIKKIRDVAQPQFEAKPATELIAVSDSLTSPQTGPNLVLLTSGTSAAPKLVVLTATALNNRLQSIEAAIPKTDRAKAMCILPTHFGHGLVGVCLSSLYSGTRLAMAPRLEPATLPRLESFIEKAEPTFISGTPASWETILRFTSAKTRKMRRAQIASASTSSAVFKKVKEWAGCATYNVYGLTEAASWVSAHEFKFDGDETNIGNGRDFGTQLYLENVDQNGVGTITIRSDGIFSGYMNQISDLAKPSLDAVYVTGDRGRVTSNGEIQLHGRQSRVINRRGVKVSAEEVELAIRSLASIEDAVVLAVGAEQDSVGVLVVLKQGLGERSDSELLELIANGLKNQISEYKLPTRIWCTSQIPRRANGKPDLAEIGLLCGLEKEN